MKVHAVTLNNGRYVLKINGALNNVVGVPCNGDINDLSGMPYMYPLSFTGIQNSSKLRTLFGYGLPCMYSGVTMIDPKYVARLVKNKTFYKPASEVLKVISPYFDSIQGVEAKALEIIKERANIHPDKTIQDLLKEVEPIYRRRLRKKQAPIFHDIKKIFKDLPDPVQSKFNDLMVETDKKLNEKPIIIPFSSFEFKYKLSKIKDDILKSENVKAKKVINKMIKESKKFTDSTSANTIEHQKQVLGLLDWILRKSVLKDNEQLNNLINLSKSRLFQEEVIVPFSRKSFIYDLAKIIVPIKNTQIQEQILAKAMELPTSQQSLSAYIMKITAEPPEKIGYRLLWPSTASVEHILPRSCGGADIMANFGGATARTNSNRKSIGLSEWVKMHPEAKQNCQKYADRLIELYHQGVFNKIGLSYKYIEDFKRTVKLESKGSINVNISELYK